ncbi:MAG: glycoside hydrolase family 5 protein, partial [Planctomycetota bacterium]
MAFAIERGVNISHWLSQSKRRGAQRRAWFTQADVAAIAALGLDHIRLPLDEEQMWDAHGVRQAEAWRLLHAALGWCLDAGLKVVVDLHILRSHHFISAEEPALYREPAALNRAAALWRDLAQDLRGYPHDQVAYELLNEPVATEDETWNRVVRRLYRVVRGAEPERLLIYGANRFNDLARLPALWLPPGDERLLISCHFYRPMAVTHYRASWMANGSYEGPVRYPGLPIEPAVIDAVGDSACREQVRWWNDPWDRSAMQAWFSGARARLAARGLSLYCNEFGVIRHAPAGPAARWHRDLRQILTSLAIPWAHWDYRGGFSVL